MGPLQYPVSAPVAGMQQLQLPAYSFDQQIYMCGMWRWQLKGRAQYKLPNSP